MLITEVFSLHIRLNRLAQYDVYIHMCKDILFDCDMSSQYWQLYLLSYRFHILDTGECCCKVYTHQVTVTFIPNLTPILFPSIMDISVTGCTSMNDIMSRLHFRLPSMNQVRWTFNHSFFTTNQPGMTNLQQVLNSNFPAFYLSHCCSIRSSLSRIVLSPGLDLRI